MFFKKIVFAALALMSLNVYAGSVEYISNGAFNSFDSDYINQTGWTVTADPGYSHFGDGVIEPDAYYEGSSSPKSGRLSQVVVGAHGAAVLSFDLSAVAGEGFEKTLWNGVELASVPTNDGLDSTHYTFNVVASGLDTLDFIGQNDQNYNMLSNVSLLAEVTPVTVLEPETWCLLLAGLASIGGLAHCRAQRAS